MMKKLCVMLCIVTFLMGCSKTAQYRIPNATISQISTLLEDYAGFNGFHITYSVTRDNKATYRIYAGTTSQISPGETQTTYEFNLTETKQNTSNSSGDLRNKAQTGRQTIRTVQWPAERISVDWNFSVQLIQDGSDVRVYAKASGGYNPIKYVKEFMDILSYHGFSIEKSR